MCNSAGRRASSIFTVLGGSHEIFIPEHRRRLHADFFSSLIGAISTSPLLSSITSSLCYMQSAFVIATCSRTATPSCQPRLSTAIGGAELHLHANSVAPGSSTSAVYGQVGELYRAVPTRLQRADSVLPNARCSTATLCRYSMRVLVPRQLKWRIACAECASTAGRWGVCAGPHRPSQAGVVPCMQLPCGTQGPD